MVKLEDSLGTKVETLTSERNQLVETANQHSVYGIVYCEHEYIRVCLLNIKGYSFDIPSSVSFSLKIQEDKLLAPLNSVSSFPFCIIEAILSVSSSLSYDHGKFSVSEAYYKRSVNKPVHGQTFPTLPEAYRVHFKSGL